MVATSYVCICLKEFDTDKGLKVHQRTCRVYQGSTEFPDGAKITSVKKSRPEHVLNVLGKRTVVK